MKAHEADSILELTVYPNCNDPMKIQVCVTIKIGLTTVHQRLAYDDLSKFGDKVLEMTHMAYSGWLEINQSIEDAVDKVKEELDFTKSGGAFTKEEIAAVEE